MPRNGSGTYSLPAGNPVVSGTTIQASWANSTLADISTELTGSLARNGAGGMLGSLRGVDGTVSVPAFSFTSETTSGFYRAGTGDVRFAMAGADVYTVTTSAVTFALPVVLAAGTAAAPSLAATGDLNTGLWFPAADTVAVSTGGTERWRLDASGNLGLGVTPSAWGAGFKAAQVDSQCAITGSGANTYLSTNWFYTTSDRYIANGFATLYRQNAGQHIFYTAPSGTAGNAISFTQAMTLDASGNLGVGTTSIACRGDFRGASGLGVQFQETSSGNSTRIQLGTSANVGYINADAGIGTIALSFLTAGTERARITNDGNLLVGSTDSTLGKFAVRGVETTAYNTATFGNGTDVQSLDVLCGRALTNNTVGGVSSSLVMTLRSSGSSPGILAFATGNNERGRVSGGDLIWGTTTTPSLANAGFVLAKDGDGTYLRNACTITTTRTHFEFVNGNGTVGTISTNASATAYNTSSDRRLKENIQPADDAGAVIDAIEIVQHDWKVGGHTRFGVVAQDLNAVAPEAVSAGDDGDEIEKAWGVDYSKLVPMLIKEIQSLRARVAALEAA